jgi:hypothetical protein
MKLRTSSIKLIIAEVFLCLLFISLPSQAKWTWYVTSADNSSVHYFEPNSIKTISNKRRLWTYYDLSDSTTSPGSYKAYEEYDCKDESTILLQLYSYPEKGLKGKINIIDIVQNKKMYIAPDSIQSVMFSILCK